VALAPTSPEPHLALARILVVQGRREDALKHAEIAAGRDPGKAYELMAEIMLDLNRPDPAADYARRSVQADATRVMGHYTLGVVAQRAGRYEEALTDFRRAEEANRLQKGSVVLALHARMADCLARLGREQDAEREFQAEIAAIPWSREGRVGLAMLYRAQGRDAEARAALEGLVSATPQAGAGGYWTGGKTPAGLRLPHRPPGRPAPAREWATRAHARLPEAPRFRRGVLGPAQRLRRLPAAGGGGGLLRRLVAFGQAEPGLRPPRVRGLRAAQQGQALLASA